MLICAFASLGYLTVSRNIFALDYSPEAKRFAILVEKEVPLDQTIYVYDGDPALRFYFSNRRAKTKNAIEPSKLIKEPGRYILISKNTLNSMDKFSYSKVVDTPDFIVLKTIE